MPVDTDIASTIPAELQLPVPRRVRHRGDTSGLGCFRTVGVVFGLVFAYLAWLWVETVRRRPLNVRWIVFLTIAALFCATISWLLLPLSLKIHRKRRLLRHGMAVAGRVVKKRQRYHRWLKVFTCYLDYEYDHPGLGRRSGTMLIDDEEWAAVAEGADVTVLCYPHRRRPTVLYEHCLFECVPEAGGPKVKQPKRISFEKAQRRLLAKSKPYEEPKPYVFPPELQRPAPRKTVRQPGTLTIGLILARVLWFGIAVFGLYTLARVPMYALVAYRGQLIEGRVEGTTDRKEGGAHYLSYSFEAAGQRHVGVRKIDTSLTELKPGQKVPVLMRTFASIPYSVVVFPGEIKFGALFEPIMEALGFNFVLTLLLGIPVWILYWIEKRLCQQGTPVIGRITRKNIRPSRRSWTSYELYYEFQHPRLGLKTSHIDVVPSRYENARVGETVTILCNPRWDTYSSTVYEYGNFMCV